METSRIIDNGIVVCMYSRKLKGYIYSFIIGYDKVYIWCSIEMGPVPASLLLTDHGSVHFPSHHWQTEHPPCRPSFSWTSIWFGLNLIVSFGKDWRLKMWKEVHSNGHMWRKWFGFWRSYFELFSISKSQTDLLPPNKSSNIAYCLPSAQFTMPEGWKVFERFRNRVSNTLTRSVAPR